MPMDKNYTEFTALDFAQELSFIRWVRHSDESAVLFWNRWLSEHPDQRLVVEQARQLVLALRVNDPEPSQAVISQLWDKIDGQTEVAQPALVRRLTLRRILPYAAVAASVVFILLFGWRPTKVVQTENAERIAVNLPDGSKIEVSAATELRYKPGRWKKERRIQLDGEAFFKVQKGEPFVVETPLGEVEVLGTSFNVKARDGYFEVNCFTGKVRVRHAGSVQILTPGLSTQLVPGATALTIPVESDPAITATWRNGRFYFQEATLDVVFDELARQYNLDIKAPQEILDRRTTTFFELANVDSALYKVCWPMQLKASRRGRVVVVE